MENLEDVTICKVDSSRYIELKRVNYTQVISPNKKMTTPHLAIIIKIPLLSLTVSVAFRRGNRGYNYVLYWCADNSPHIQLTPFFVKITHPIYKLAPYFYNFLEIA